MHCPVLLHTLLKGLNNISSALPNINNELHNFTAFLVLIIILGHFAWMSTHAFGLKYVLVNLSIKMK